MESLKEIKRIRQNSNSILELFDKKIPLWKSNPSHYDKVDWGFNIDKRFAASEPASIFFGAYKGVYGDSGCSSQISLDKDIFINHLLKYLNENKESIMKSIAISIEKQAAELKDKATAELNSQMEYLKELEETS